MCIQLVFKIHKVGCFRIDGKVWYVICSSPRLIELGIFRFDLVDDPKAGEEDINILLSIFDIKFMQKYISYKIVVRLCVI